MVIVVLNWNWRDCDCDCGVGRSWGLVFRCDLNGVNV